jgi:hypothetical protein
MYDLKKAYNVTTITATSYDRKVSVELPLDSNAFEVFEAFKTIMVGMTFSPKSFDDAVVAYFYEYGLDKDGDDALDKI